jgi:hypothetical protein
MEKGDGMNFDSFALSFAGLALISSFPFSGRERMDPSFAFHSQFLPLMRLAVNPVCCT